MKVLITNICRFLLAVVFLFSGFVKANDPEGMAIKLSDYLAAFGIEHSHWVVLTLAVVLAFVELITGIYLLFGIHRRTMSLWVLIFTSLMTLLTLYILIVNPVEDCGCFGDVIRLSHTQTFLKNILLLAAAVVLFVWSKLQFQLLPGCLGWILRGAAMIAVVAYSIFCIITQPVIDFSDYHIGTDLLERVPLRVDGIQISTPRYQSQDFFITDANDDDITEDILSAPRAYILIIRDLATASQSCISEINNLYDYALEHDATFCAVTGSDPEAVKQWRDETSAHYDIQFSDSRILSSVVRSNPGLLVLENGVVHDKFAGITLGHNIRQILKN